jgi:hypothetical protein
MASDTKAVIDEWSGEADPHAMTEAEERAFVEVGLDSVRRHGSVPEDAADRAIDAMLADLRSR